MSIGNDLSASGYFTLKTGGILNETVVSWPLPATLFIELRRSLDADLSNHNN